MRRLAVGLRPPVPDGSRRRPLLVAAAVVVAAVLAATLTLVLAAEPRSGAAPSGVAMPLGDLPGWRQVFTDDFRGPDLGDQWFRYGPSQPEGDPGGWFDPSRVSVADGRLTIGAWPDPARGNLYVTGGVSNRNVFTQTYGRFEVRFRAEAGTGIAFALLLWPTSNESRPEIDFAEDNGRDRRTLYGFLHPADPRRPTVERSVAADTTQWHTAGLEWTPGRLVYTLDGDPWAVVESPHVPDVPMSLALQSQAWYCGDTWQACPDHTTPERVDLEVDWVAIYAYDP